MLTLEQLSESANRSLMQYLDAYLVGLPSEFSDDVLHAIRIAAPLRERTYLARLATDISGADWDAVQPLAFAAELFIVSALTADDAIDGAETRSGQPSLYHRRGPARSFLIAEWLHAVATFCLWQRKTNIDNAAWERAAQEFQDAFRMFFVSQYSTSHLERNPDVAVETLDGLARGRTGRLLEVCLAAPAIVTASTETAEALAKCGRWLGIAFQHRDDILDFIAESDVIGKPVLLDLLNGQPNLVLSHAFTITHDQSIRDTLLRYFGAAATNPDVRRQTSNLQEDILSVLRTSGSLSFAARRVQDYCSRAIDAMRMLPSSLAKDRLENFVRLVATIQFAWEADV